MGLGVLLMKKLSILIAVAIISVSMCACNTSSDTSQASKQNSESSSDVNSNSGDVNTINLNETVTVEEYGDFTVKKFEFTDTVKAYGASAGGYAENREGLTYLDMIVEYTNNSSKEICFYNNLHSEITYSGNYVYTGNAYVESKDGTKFDYYDSTISNGETRLLHFAFNVPDCVESGSENISASINFGEELSGSDGSKSYTGSSYQLTLRDGSKDKISVLSGSANKLDRGEIKIGDIINVNDTIEFELKEGGWAEEIKPHNPGTSYGYLNDKDDKIYAYCYLNIKNGSATKLDDEIEGEIIYDNKRYLSSEKAETPDGSDFDNFDIIPLQSGNLYIVTELPDDAKNSEPLDFKITILGNEYTYTLE